MKNRFTIENPKGSYKSFETEDDITQNQYPLKGVTYPVDYGYLEGYIGEDGHDLDLFVGSGNLSGYIKVWRNDVPLETKMVKNVTHEEWDKIVEAFSPVIREKEIFDTPEAFEDFIRKFRNDI